MSKRPDRLSPCIEPRILFLIRLPELQRAKAWRRIRVGGEKRSLRAQKSGAYHRRRKSLRRCGIREVYDVELIHRWEPSTQRRRISWLSRSLAMFAATSAPHPSSATWPLIAGRALHRNRRRPAAARCGRARRNRLFLDRPRGKGAARCQFSGCRPLTFQNGKRLIDAYIARLEGWSVGNSAQYQDGNKHNGERDANRLCNGTLVAHDCVSRLLKNDMKHKFVHSSLT